MATYQTPITVQLADTGLTVLATLADPDDPTAPHSDADYVDMGGFTETGPVKDSGGDIVAYEYSQHGLTLPSGARSSLLIHTGTVTGHATFALARADDLVELGRLPIDPQDLETATVVKNALTTQDAQQIAAALAGGTYTIHRGDTVTLNFADLGDISDRAELWFCGKYCRDKDDDDAAAILVGETAGLVRINRATPASGQTASITITDAAAGTGYVTVPAATSKSLNPISRGDWDIQVLRSDGTVETLTENGRNADPAQYFKITGDVTRRTSSS